MTTTPTPRNGATSPIRPHALGAHTMSVLKFANDAGGQIKVTNSTAIAAASLANYGLATIVWDAGLEGYHGTLALTDAGWACAQEIRP